MARKILAYEVIDHGVDHAQYFLGCGTAFTPFDFVQTGVGSTPHEALEDCLDQIAMLGFDTDGIKNGLSDETPEELEDTDEYSELYYYVSVRFNVI